MAALNLSALKYSVLRSSSLPLTNTVGVEFTFALAPAAATLETQSLYAKFLTHEVKFLEAIPAV